MPYYIQFSIWYYCKNKLILFFPWEKQWDFLFKCAKKQVTNIFFQLFAFEQPLFIGDK